MSEEKDLKLDADTILPYGEKLRPLIASSFLTKGDLKKLLAMRGVFVSNNNKEITIPILTTCLLSPQEFEYLRNRQRTKEDTIKRVTRKIDWDSDLNLFDAMKKNIIPFHELISERFCNYRILDTRNRFLAIENNKDELKLEYKIDRNDPTKDWATSNSRHIGKIFLKKINSGNELEISIEYTALETKELNEKIVKHVTKALKENKCIGMERKFKKITFGDFTNKERVKFLLSLHNDDPYDIFKFEEITNIEISIDTSKNLPDNIKWMEKKVRNMILKGEQLHDTDILKEPEYHEALIVSGVEAKYKFESVASKGFCTIEYGFPAFRKGTPDNNSEFEFKIISLKVESEKPRKKVERFLLAKFDNFKSKMYDSFKGNL
ncbi:hypothetical protein QCI42_07320 [Bacillus fungorum]|uniref:GapS4b family protein n=1 Tax=Bacillus fungorum TaxID=2039284 RepID=UPI003395393A